MMNYFCTLVGIFLVFVYVTGSGALSAGSCSYNNNLYRAGQTFLARDGCNNCTCIYSFYSCTKYPCAQLSNTTTSKENDTCRYNGHAYSSGETFEHLDGCNACQCSTMGVMCTSKICPTTTTTRPPFTCRWMGLPYRDGDTLPAGDGCNTCSCQSGSVLCTAKFVCPPAVG